MSKKDEIKTVESAYKHRVLIGGYRWQPGIQQVQKSALTAKQWRIAAKDAKITVKREADNVVSDND